MRVEEILLAIASLSPFIFVKIFILVLLLFYIIFAVIVFRQVELMNEMVEAQISPILRMLALFHLASAIFLFLLSIFLL